MFRRLKQLFSCDDVLNMHYHVKALTSTVDSCELPGGRGV